jgi:rubredoxin
LREHVFDDLLQGFAQPPGVAVVLSDPTQHVLPCAFGRINVLAGAQEDQWQLRVSPGVDGAGVSPGMVRSGDVAGAVARIAPLLTRPVESTEAWTHALADALEGLLLPATPEGAPALRRYALSPDTLALAAPPGDWDARRLQEIAFFATQHGVGNIGLSPWRGLLIPGLDAAARHAFEEACLRWRWAPESNPWRQWLLVDPSLEETADQLTRLLYERCRVNPGYAIALRHAAAPSADVHFDVRPESRCGMLSWWRPNHYQLRIRQEGDPRDGAPRAVLSGLPLEDIAEALLLQIDAVSGGIAPIATDGRPPAHATREVAYQCEDCGTEYDARYGDIVGHVEAATSFDALPETWCCPVCGGPKTHYHRVGHAA